MATPDQQRKLERMEHELRLLRVSTTMQVLQVDVLVRVDCRQPAFTPMELRARARQLLAELDGIELGDTS